MCDACRLYVGNLPANITKVQLRDIFQRTGDVIDVYIPLRHENDIVTREALGHAFVEMQTPDEAQTAIRIMDHMYGPDGRKMFVRIATPRAQLAT